jgi:hypothetical protein
MFGPFRPLAQYIGSSVLTVRAVFHSLSRLYVKNFFAICLSAIRRTCISTVVQILEFYYLN